MGGDSKGLFLGSENKKDGKISGKLQGIIGGTVLKTGSGAVYELLVPGVSSHIRLSLHFFSQKIATIHLFNEKSRFFIEQS